MRTTSRHWLYPGELTVLVLSPVCEAKTLTFKETEWNVPGRSRAWEKDIPQCVSFALLNMTIDIRQCRSVTIMSSTDSRQMLTQKVENIHQLVVHESNHLFIKIQGHLYCLVEERIKGDIHYCSLQGKREWSGATLIILIGQKLGCQVG
jgi:hypothetical protein